MLPSVKMRVPLLWGLCVVLFMGSVTTSTPETNMSVTVKPNDTIRETTAAHVATERKEKEVVSNKTDGSVTTVEGLVILKTTATEAVSESLGSTAETTVKDEVQHSHVTAVPDSANHTTEQFHQSAATTFTDRTAPSNASAATVAGPASELSSTASVDAFTHRDLIQKLTNTTACEPEGPAEPTSEAALIHDAAEAKMSTSTESSYAPQFISATSVHTSTSQSAETKPSSPFIPDPADTVASTSTSSSSSTISVHNSTSRILDLLRSSSTSADSLSATATITSSPAGISTSQAPRTSTVLTPQPTLAMTVTPSEASETSPCISVQPCSTWATVKQCLIVIASLAAIATIFMVSTIVLCVKLSERRYKLRKPQQETEMMCISALLPERNHTYIRQRNPISNGVMVYPMGGDSDEELGDNLTLSSFLPENV